MGLGIWTFMQLFLLNRDMLLISLKYMSKVDIAYHLNSIQLYYYGLKKYIYWRTFFGLLNVEHTSHQSVLKCSLSKRNVVWWSVKGCLNCEAKAQCGV